jgi:hypothetical protein
MTKQRFVEAILHWEAVRLLFDLVFTDIIVFPNSCISAPALSFGCFRQSPELTPVVRFFPRTIIPKDGFLARGFEPSTLKEI